MTDGDQARKGIAASRIRLAAARERALGALPVRVRSPAAARDRALTALAATAGPRAAAREVVDSISVRHPRAGEALRDVAGRLLGRYGARGASPPEPSGVDAR